MALAIHERRVALASASRTATVASPRLSDLFKWRGAIVTLNVTAASGAGGLTLSVRGYDAFGSAYNLLVASAAVIATGVISYVIHPGVSAPAGSNVAQVASIPIPQDLDIVVTHGDASSYTYGVSLELLP